MSEFSESYHLRSADLNEGVALLRRAGLKGYVLPSTKGWVSLVADENSFGPDQRIIAQNRGTLLHYVFAEDHGWTFALFEGAEEVSGYDCGWEDDVRVDDSRYSPQVLARALGPAGPQAVAAIESVLHPADIDEAIDSQPAKAFAEAMRLPRFKWFAYDYVAHDFHERPQGFAGVVKIE